MQDVTVTYTDSYVILLVRAGNHKLEFTINMKDGDFSLSNLWREDALQSTWYHDLIALGNFSEDGLVKEEDA